MHLWTMCDGLNERIQHIYIIYVYVFLSTSEGRARVKHFAVLIGGGDVSRNVYGTTGNARQAAHDGIEMFVFGKFILMPASLMVVGRRISLLYFNAKLAFVLASISWYICLKY